MRIGGPLSSRLLGIGVVVGVLYALAAASAVAQPNVPTGKQKAASDVILDGGFEGGIPNPSWNPETSTNFGTPLCDLGSCGNGGGASPPRTGAIWAWFGGIPAAETATIGQTVTIPANTAQLQFWMRIGTVSSPFSDVLNVRMDGVILQSYPEPSVAEGAYTLRVINLNAYANGASHALLFEYIGSTSGTGSYVIDDVALQAGASTAVAVASTAVTRTTQGVSVSWVTGASNGVLGYRVYRQDGANRVRVSPMIRARGSIAGSRYSFVDRSAPSVGSLRYWIQTVRLDGSTTWYGPVVLAA